MKFYFFIILFCIVSSCKKIKQENFSYLTYDVGESIKLHKVIYVNDLIWYVGGGKRSDFGKIFKTVDGGKTWQFFNTKSLYPSSVYDIHVFNKNRVLAGGDSLRWFMTENGGDTWSYRWFEHDELSFHEIHRTRIKRYCFLDDSVGFFVGGDQYRNGVFYKTNNGGNKWQFDTLEHELNGIDFINKMTGIICGYGYIAKTSDGGNSFQQLSLRDDNFKSVSMLSASNAIIVSDKGIIYRTENGGSDWDKVLKKTKFSFNDIRFHDSSIGYAIGNFGVILRTSDSGKNWVQLKFSDKTHLNKLSFYENKGIIAGDNGKIYVFEI